MAKPTIRGTTIGAIAGLATGVGPEVGASIGSIADARSIYTSKTAQSIGRALSRYPHTRSGEGVTDRRGQIISWRLANGTTVQMYINPQSLVIADTKNIQSTRTKGGFVVQYWGEDLTRITIQGTTGSAGIKGINILRDIYRSENKGFDLIAAQQLNDVQRLQNKVNLGQDLAGAMVNISDTIRERNFLLRPSLASLSASVIMHYQGVQYKGFFNSFTVTENTSRLGMFNYDITFTAYETRGSRKNWAAWHKEPAADDAAGVLVNSLGNLVRGAFNLDPQAPAQFFPETAPLTFGGNSVASGLGLTEEPLTEHTPIIV